jgi:pheromone a factor receptor
MWLGIFQTDQLVPVVVLYRLAENKNEFSKLLASNASTTKSRFTRLMILSLVMLLGSFPTEMYVLYSSIADYQPWETFSWDVVHGPKSKTIEKVPMYGQVYYDRWIHVAAGFLLFLFFGLGRDAILMYQSTLVKLGFGRVFPSLKHPHIKTPHGSSSSTSRAGLLGSFTKGFLKKISLGSGAGSTTSSSSSS